MAKTSVLDRHVYATGFHGKICSKCDGLLDVDQFNVNPQSTDGLHAWCRKCKNEKYREVFNYPEEHAARKRKQVNWSLNNKYGITIEDREAMAVKQDYKCLICRREKSLVVDHDHLTGAVRGLLCIGCNAGIGNFNESAEFMKSAIAYMESF